MASIAGKLPLRAAAKSGDGIYQRIGVRPLVNCKGTYTIITGSQTLPEVKAAMDEAGRHYVHLDELMDAVGQRLADLTKAPWGMVSAGCAAALTHSTAACMVGSNPEKMQRLPLTAGFKHEVVMPRESRNVYDHAIRMTGAHIVTPASRAEFLAALRPSTAMVALLGATVPQHPMALEEMTEAAHRQGIPVLVDAAAERLTIPNYYLGKGVDLVAYSGGKCLRGPQCAGLLLGRKDLLKAAWINSAPHHAFGRSLKVGKEEIMGMLAAVEAWTKRNHDAEWKQWEGWLGHIKDKVEAVNGVRTEKVLPTGPSNNAPQLKITWDASKINATGTEIAAALLAGDPRVILHFGDDFLQVMPYMMVPGDDKIAGERLQAVLKNPPARAPQPAPGTASSVAGQWDVHLEYVRGEATHTLYLEEANGKLRGQHRGEFLSGDLTGTRTGARVRFASSHAYEGTALGYHFDGAIVGDTMSGTVDLEEYGKAQFTAKRHWA
jgi:uncharacterized pyridoxal phosphate-dependent enzyme